MLKTSELVFIFGICVLIVTAPIITFKVNRWINWNFGYSSEVKETISPLEQKIKELEERIQKLESRD